MHKITKPKRGITKYSHPNYGEVFYNNTRDDGMIVVCDSPNFKVTDNYYPLDPETLTEAVKQRVGLQSKVKPLSEKKKNEKQLLNEFYDQLILKMPYLCCECSKPLFAFNKFAKRSCCAHIFGKADFPKISTNELNIFYLPAEFLGGCGHHDAWDRLGAEHRTTMKVYKIALERFEKLKASMTDHEIIKAMTYLNLTYGN
jgi:hypothetical protein